MRRLPDQWFSLSADARIAFAFWSPDTQALSKKLQDGLLAQVEAFLMRGTVSQDKGNSSLERVLNLCAIHFQSGACKATFAWFFNVYRQHPAQAFAYPFLDYKLAAIVGPLAVQFLLKLNELHLSESSECPTERIDQIAKKYSNSIRALIPYSGLYCLLIEAAQRGIPVTRHSDLPSYQLGYGGHRRIMRNGFTDRTSQIASTLSTHKQLSAQVLRENKLPVPRQFTVTTLEQARLAARHLACTLVVKPTSTDKGVGVSVNVLTDEELQFAWSQASPHGNVLIEEMIPGDDHRLHVVDGRCIYVVRRMQPYVVGNGWDTVARLVEEYGAQRKAHPIYRNFDSASLSDPAVLRCIEKQHFQTDSILDPGKKVFLRTNANVSTGGTAEEVTAQTHPDNIALAEKAARVIGLDNAGIDFITEDISKSWLEGGGKICEINPTPAAGLPEVAVPALLNYLFPRQGKGRIPLIVMIGSRQDLAEPIQIFAEEAEQSLATFGYIAGKELVIKGSHGIFKSAGVNTGDLLTGLLSDDSVKAALIQIDFPELKHGLNIHYADLVVLCGSPVENDTFSKSPIASSCQDSDILFKPTLEEFLHCLRTCLSYHRQ